MSGNQEDPVRANNFQPLGCVGRIVCFFSESVDTQLAEQVARRCHFLGPPQVARQVIPGASNIPDSGDAVNAARRHLGSKSKHFGFIVLEPCHLQIGTPQNFGSDQIRLALAHFARKNRIVSLCV